MIIARSLFSKSSVFGVVFHPLALKETAVFSNSSGLKSVFSKLKPFFVTD